MTLKGLNLAGKSPLPAPRVVPKTSPEFEKIVESETREADRLMAETDKILKTTPAAVPVVERNISDENEKLSRLVDDDFPFDDTQLTAIYGLIQQQYGVMIGAAGTGKTTTTKKLVDMLRDGLAEIDVSQYWNRGQPEEHDDYQIPEKLIPSIAMVSFTGRATQMIKKNFPRDWHGNIMTIHRALGFYPEFYQDLDADSGNLVNKRRFVPAYNQDNLMPWDIIIVDEAGMLGLELWHQLWAATQSTTRIILIGDINQLPPTHGKSILGFALASWPTWELTHVHRQQGANNSIVDNAHRILKGLRPVSDSPSPLSLKTDKDMLSALNFMAKDDSWRFITVEVPEDHRLASLRIRQCLQLLQGKIYEPNRDVLITPINGFEQTAPGYTLGQQPMNQELVVKLNSKNPRYLIDAGREKQNFAVGDKVMATVNDYEAGITNGMTGIIVEIKENGAYVGDTQRWGLISEVNDYLAGLAEMESDDEEFTLEELVADSQTGLEEAKQREKRDAGPASHIIEVEFGEGESAFKISFDSKSKVASLMLAYAATCHKMQGGECPLVFGIVHQANKRPLNREWFYTMVTRASKRCVVFTTRQGLGFALGKQNIKGATLEAKIKTFVALTESGLIGPSVRVKIPKPRKLTDDEIETAIPQSQAGYGKTQIQQLPANPEGNLASRASEEAAANAYSQDSTRRAAEEVASSPSIRVGSLHIHIHEASSARTSAESKPESNTAKGLKILLNQTRTPKRSWNEVVQQEINDPNGKLHVPALPAPAKLVSQWGAYETLRKIEDAQAIPLLTYQPQPTPTPTKPLSIGQLLMRNKK